MEMVQLEIERIIHEAFSIIFSSEIYSERGHKKYRILFFAYLFGFVTEKDLYYLFLDKKEVFHIYKIEDERHSNASILRYMSAPTYGKPMLHREGKVYFLTAAGTDEIWILVKNLFSLDDSVKELFVSHKRKRLDTIIHGHIAGASAFTLMHEMKDSKEYHLLIEPFIVHGEHQLKHIKARGCRPDVILYNDARKVYIEADTGKEGHEAIAEKLERYMNHILLKDASSADLLFVHHLPWMEKVYKESQKRWEEAQSIIKGFKFIQKLYPEYEIFFEDYFNRIKVLEPALTEENARNIAPTCEEFAWNVEEENICFLYGSKFLSRKKKIEEIVSENRAFVRVLEEGTRLLIVPLLALSWVYPKVFFEKERDYIKSFMKKQFGNLEIVDMVESKSFIDGVSGNIYTFRNCVKAIDLKGQQMWYCFENISDDYGALCRMKKLVLSEKNNAICDLNLICICTTKYSYFENEKYLQKYRKSYGLAKVKLVYWDDFCDLGRHAPNQDDV